MTRTAAGYLETERKTRLGTLAQLWALGIGIVEARKDSGAKGGVQAIVKVVGNNTRPGGVIHARQDARDRLLNELGAGVEVPERGGSTLAEEVGGYVSCSKTVPLLSP